MFIAHFELYKHTYTSLENIMSLLKTVLAIASIMITLSPLVVSADQKDNDS